MSIPMPDEGPVIEDRIATADIGDQYLTCNPGLWCSFDLSTAAGQRAAKKLLEGNWDIPEENL